MRSPRFSLPVLVGLTALAVAVSACSTTGMGDTADAKVKPVASADAAAKRHEISAAVDNTLSRMGTELRGSKELLARAKGVLVFPAVLAGGFVVGAEYGEGELRVDGRSAGYYRTTSGSIGLQAGAQSKAMIFLFMTPEALARFRAGDGWSAGADASVALLKIGANGDIDTNTVQAPVVGFVMTNAGLMANLTLEGTKVTRLAI